MITISVDKDEYVISVDKFLKPKVLTGSKATSILLVRLILLEPGVFQAQPDLGVGIISRFRYSDEEDLPVLRNRIDQQIATYLPELQDVSVEVTAGGNHDILINISADGGTYMYKFDKEALSLEELMSL